MEALTILFPVFFMMALGFVSRVRGWITPQQKEGAKAIVFTVLFPILIFQLTMTANIERSTIFLVLYVVLFFTVCLVVGKLLSGFTGKKFAHMSPYLLTSCEASSVTLPLYISIVGPSVNTVLIDLGGLLFVFILLPVVLARQTAASTSAKGIAKNIFTNSFVIAVIAGLLMNFTGAYAAIMHSAAATLVTDTLSQATAPIVGVILFVLGYELTIDKEMLGSLVKLFVLRLALYLVCIEGFYLLFPQRMSDKIFAAAVWLYFMSPPGFALPTVISPVIKSEEDQNFCSALISLFLIVTLIVYTVLVVTW
ncbi:MAG: AEC family transporter [Lachnospiraceae bacterium]|nr:AEC family transporter [Lachnospiraceae bacterium]